MQFPLSQKNPSLTRFKKVLQKYRHRRPSALFLPAKTDSMTVDGRFGQSFCRPPGTGAHCRQQENKTMTALTVVIERAYTRYVSDQDQALLD
ncbi:MAG: hypothetical protein K2O70_08130, partial [Desulfovibrionaceae bacterium]|nr:hypothetical protein [Desulfovibrionaceae bacterium]